MDGSVLHVKPRLTFSLFYVIREVLHGFKLQQPVSNRKNTNTAERASAIR